MKRETEMEKKIKLDEIKSLIDRLNFTNEQYLTFKEFTTEKEFKADQQLKAQQAAEKI